MLAYWMLSVLFCSAWACAAYARRDRSWLCAWFVAQCIQAILTTIAGPGITERWATLVWLPVEAAALAILCCLLADVLPSQYLIAAAALTAGLFAEWRPVAPPLLADFAAFREWLWVSVACALVAYSVSVLRRSVLPATFSRAVLVLALYAVLMAATGLAGLNGWTWMPARAVYRSGAILCCLLWSLTPRYSGESVEAGEDRQRRHPHPGLECRALPPA